VFFFVVFFFVVDFVFLFFFVLVVCLFGGVVVFFSTLRCHLSVCRLLKHFSRPSLPPFYRLLPSIPVCEHDY